jgi:DNA-binding MarR family transcriptional regulator
MPQTPSTPSGPAIGLKLDPYLVATLMPDLVGHDRRPSAYLVYLTLWCRTHALGIAQVAIALEDLAEATGLAKRTVQHAIDWLLYRKLVQVSRSTLTEVGTFTVLTPWIRTRRAALQAR